MQMSVDHVITLIIGIFGGGGGIALGRGIWNFFTGKQERKRDSEEEAWDLVKEARLELRACEDDRRSAAWEAHMLRLDLADCHAALLRAGLPLPPTRHSIPALPFTPPTPSFDPTSIIEPPRPGAES